MNEKETSICFSPLDIHFARLLEGLAKTAAAETVLAAKMVSFYGARGHVCLPLEIVAGRKTSPPGFPDEVTMTPSLSRWVQQLRKSSLVGNGENDFTPLVLDNRNRLYLRRYWDYERQLVERILTRARKSAKVDLKQIGRHLNELYPSTGTQDVNWQKLAAFAAVTKNLCVISGGPGTGKTRTVVVILALLLQQNPKTRIALCAPTGKAAARLKEAIQLTKTQLGLPEELQQRIPADASTIHRLLGNKPDSPYFQHDTDRPLPHDVLIVDEASMVDLALMAKLFAAAKPSARIILLGDKDQLASVESGAVLGDICNNGERVDLSVELVSAFESATGEEINVPVAVPATGLEGNIIELQKNYRFGEQSGIYQVSRMINEGNAKGALSVLENATGADLCWKRLPERGALKQALKETVLSGYREPLQCKDPAEALKALGTFRILCALRQGPFGVTELNRLVEEILMEEGLIQLKQEWYRGRPIMITRNDYNLQLFNGDIGIILPGTGEEMRAWFLSAEGALKQFLPARLPAHETVYAMTIHKSQGSEFKKIAMILPDKENSVLTRELVYTGITRARQHVELWTDEEVCRRAVMKRIERNSGLRDALWSAAN